MGSVTAEIFLILTNVTWENVAWTTVTGVANTKVKKKEKDGRCKKENIHRKKRTFFERIRNSMVQIRVLN